MTLTPLPDQVPLDKPAHCLSENCLLLTPLLCHSPILAKELHQWYIFLRKIPFLSYKETNAFLKKKKSLC